jgi:pyruvate/2-oxoglutarate dehydrogenase complex dihydrolipoamide dehydrogenase (E3) component/uncharacterized membrane protein YdjX (TVP38/TMEM64 family)
MPRALLLIILLVLVAAFLLFDLAPFLSFDYIKTQQQNIANFYADRPLQAVAGFFALYIIVTGMSLPGATPLSLAGGAIFGLFGGVVIVSFASTIGATLSFVGSRWLFRDVVQNRFGEKLVAINRGIEREGAFYLFALRLVPVLPFFVINVAMGLSPIGLWRFVWVSQVGMLLGTVVYVNAGTELAQVESANDIFALGVLVSFAALGVLPLLAKWLVDSLRADRVYDRWRRPRHFDRNVIVIGAGSAGLVASYIAASVKAKVTLVEKDRMGGDCLYTGCVPSKALLRSARLLAEMAKSDQLGIRSAQAEFDFADVMARVQRVVGDVAPRDSVERYTSLGVECLEGEATIVSPWEVEVQTANERQSFTTRSIVIAAGARPFVPSIPGIKDVGYVTSDTVWKLQELPRRLLVLGGGPVGSELAQAFARFGSRVTQVERLPRILNREDSEVSLAVMERFNSEGIDVCTEHEAKRFLLEGEERVLVAEHQGKEVRIPFDVLLCATGRLANTSGYGLEELGITTTSQGTVDTNEYLQTLYPNIYACGDVAGPFQYTHIASHQAWYAIVNSLFGRFRKFRVDYSVIPWAIFTEPEVARVGLNETEALERGISHEVTTYGINNLDRAIVDGAAEGFVKVLLAPGKDRILGATIVGARAGETIIEFILAMKHGIGLNKILGTIHVYPTMSEANKHAAGNWRRAHVSPRTTKWLERYHRWMRGRRG